MKNVKEIFKSMDIERLFVVPIFVFLIFGNSVKFYSDIQKALSLWDLPSLLLAIYGLLLISFYLLVVKLFFVREQATTASKSIWPKVLAYAGSLTPFLVPLAGDGDVAQNQTCLSIFVMTTGLIFSIYSLLNLGKSFGITPEVRTFVHSGPYRFIRHPLYVGEIIIFAGVILVGFSFVKLYMFLLFVCIQIYRSVQEEKLLKETILEYAAYKKSTKRFIPRLI